MDRVALRDAVYKLSELDLAIENNMFAYEQAVNQFNFLLDSARSLYPERADIQGMHSYQALNLDKSDRGPGLVQLVKQARDERLFGRDTLRSLDTLVDYRDLIHPRAAVRNKTPRNSARVDTAVTAIKLLCNELQDPTARYK